MYLNLHSVTALHQYKYLHGIPLISFGCNEIQKTCIFNFFISVWAHQSQTEDQVLLSRLCQPSPAQPTKATVNWSTNASGRYHRAMPSTVTWSQCPLPWYESVSLNWCPCQATFSIQRNINCNTVFYDSECLMNIVSSVY